MQSLDGFYTLTVTVLFRHGPIKNESKVWSNVTGGTSGIFVG